MLANLNSMLTDDECGDLGINFDQRNIVSPQTVNIIKIHKPRVN